MITKICVTFTICLVFLLHLFFCNASNTDWCNGPCGKDHVACYDPKTDPYFCPNARILEISKEDKQDIVDRYNYNRNRVATGKYPGTRHQASRMLKVHWDDDLEEIARAALLRCRTTTYCTKVTEDSNAYAFTRWQYTDANETGLPFYVLDTMFNILIHDDFRGLHNEFMNGKLKSIVQNGFLQLIGSYSIAKPTSFDENLYKVACVFVLYPENDNNEANFKPWLQSTCYYRFTKSITTDMIMYKTGLPCSECYTVGRRCSKQFPGLCETSEDNSVTYPESQGTKVSVCS